MFNSFLGNRRRAFSHTNTFLNGMPFVLDESSEDFTPALEALLGGLNYGDFMNQADAGMLAHVMSISQEDAEGKPLVMPESMVLDLEETSCPPDTQCAICLEDCEEKCTLLPQCEHRFHTECIGTWLSERNYTCPNCRKPAFDADRYKDSMDSEVIEFLRSVEQQKSNQERRAQMPPFGADTDSSWPFGVDPRNASIGQVLTAGPNNYHQQPSRPVRAVPLRSAPAHLRAQRKK